MEKYFRQMAEVYKHYKTEEKKRNDSLTKAQQSGNYSSNYLSGLAAANNEELKGIYHECNNTLSGIRGEILEALKSKNDLLGRTINSRLQAVLDSGINLTLDEWQELARKSEGNPVESRLLHDRAQAAGTTLNNYISTDEAMKIVDRYIREISNSMYGVNPIVAPVQSVEEAQEKAGAYFRAATVPDFDCFVTPTSLEEMITRDCEERQRATKPDKEHSAAFEKGMNVQTNTGALPEESYMDDDELHFKKRKKDLEMWKEAQETANNEMNQKGSFQHITEQKKIDMEHENSMRALNLERQMHDEEQDREALKRTEPKK